MALRKELRQIIGAVFGVLPLYFGEMPTGWSQEGLQVTITNRAIKWGQDILLKSFLQKLALLRGVNDWELRLKSGEETDRLRDLQIQGVEIENMKSLQGLGFEISRTHTGEFKVSKDPVVTTLDMATSDGTLDENPEGLKPGGRGSGTAAPKEDQQRFEGEPQHKVPSQVGGIAGGHPASGHGTSLSRKSYPKGITPLNYEAVKRTLQQGLDFGWTKKRTVE